MGLKYSRAIIAGIVGSAVIGILIVARYGLNVISEKIMYMGVCAGCVVLPLTLIVIFATGAMASRFTFQSLKSGMDAAAIGAIAGCIVGVLMEAVTVAMSLILQFLYKDHGIVRDAIFDNEVGTSLCCAPFWIAIAIIVATAGSVLYYYKDRKIVNR